MLKPTLSVPCYDGKLFTWVRGDGLAEASDLAPCDAPIATRVWADSYDAGFRVRSHRTGKEVLFLYETAKVDSEGEEQAWVYVSQDRRHKVTIFND